MRLQRNNESSTKRFSRISLMALFSIFSLLSACDTVTVEDNGLSAESTIAGNGRATTSTIYTFAENAETGSSILRRNNSAISANVSTSQLTENYTYTLWWVVFDEPQNCTAPSCGSDDVADAMAGGPNAADLSILGAADGSLVGADGKAYYTGKLAKGDASKAIFGNGLDNPLTAEIHYVIRSHGPAIPGLVQEQITTFNGGCNPGQANEGLCQNVQFAIHIAN